MDKLKALLRRRVVLAVLAGGVAAGLGVAGAPPAVVSAVSAVINSLAGEPAPAELPPFYRSTPAEK